MIHRDLSALTIVPLERRLISRFLRLFINFRRPVSAKGGKDAGKAAKGGLARRKPLHLDMQTNIFTCIGNYRVALSKGWRNMRKLPLLSLLVFVGFSGTLSAQQPGKENTIYKFQVTTIDGKKVDLAKYKGKVIMIVNVASECGYTDQ